MQAGSPYVSSIRYPGIRIFSRCALGVGTLYLLTHGLAGSNLDATTSFVNCNWHASRFQVIGAVHGWQAWWSRRRWFCIYLPRRWRITRRVHPWRGSIPRVPVCILALRASARFNCLGYRGSDSTSYRPRACWLSSGNGLTMTRAFGGFRLFVTVRPSWILGDTNRYWCTR